MEKDKRIAQYDARISEVFKLNDACKKIADVEGIGVITATAIVAMVGDAKVFKNGRHFSAYLGLVPKQYSSGNKNRLLGISKRGDTYIRTLLIHGARAVVRYCDSKKDVKSQWLSSLKERRGVNKTIVALANKNARVIWALLAKDKNYEKAA